MAYIGKFKDNTPIICPAGLPSAAKGTVQQCLKDYPMDDAIVAVMNEGGLTKVDPIYKQQRMENVRHRGIYVESRELLRPPVETRYQTLLKDLEETVKESYWNKELGRGRDPYGGLPKGMDPANTTFGKAQHDDVTMKELVNPPKSTYEVLYETDEFHKMYRKSHNDYYTGEKINRNYSSSFDPNRRFGKRTNYDPRGIFVRCALEGSKGEPLIAANKVQADFLARTKFRLGQSLQPIGNETCLPEGHRFGDKSRLPLHVAKDLLKPEIEPSLPKRDFYAWMAHLNQVRKYLRKYPTNLQELVDMCKHYDQELSGWIKFEIVYEVLMHFNLTLDKRLLLPLAEMFGFYRDGLAKYSDFILMLDPNNSLPDIGKFPEDYDPCPYYLTTNQAARLDKFRCDYSNSSAAGTPSRRLDLDNVAVPVGASQFETCNLGSETNVDILLRPSIFSNYHLNHRDFFQGRDREYLRKLFENVGYEFPENTFETLWEMGVEMDGTGKVCIETFKNLLEKSAPITIRSQTPEDCIDPATFKRKC